VRAWSFPIVPCQRRPQQQQQQLRQVRSFHHHHWTATTFLKERINFTTKRVKMSSEKVTTSSLESSPSLSSLAQQKDLPKVVIIAGPTGTGKSDVAAIICDTMKGIIVSADSVQVYDNVQIGANKPSRETLQVTPHILINVVDHTTPYMYNTAEWRRDAIYAIEQLVNGDDASSNISSYLHSNEIESLSEQTKIEDQQRQKYIRSTIEEAKAIKENILDQKNNTRQSPEGEHSIDSDTIDDSKIINMENTKLSTKSSSYLPVVVGGTMMYVQWLVHGRPDAVRPSEDAVQRAQEVMTKYSQANDWVSATKFVSAQGTVYEQQVQKLFPSDWYRLRRILEVAITVAASTTPIPIEQVYSGIRENGLSAMGYDVRCFFLCPDDRMKHTKIVDLRCEQMIVRGLLEETTHLVIKNEIPDMVSRAIGYRQSMEYLQREDPKWNDVDSFNDFISKFTAATRQYSQRQMKWFRRENNVMFVPVPLHVDDPKQRIQEVANKVIKYIQMSNEEYDAALRSPTAESHAVRLNNAAQAKGMKIYQLKKQILCNNSPELLHAIAVADMCTQRFQVAKQKRRIHNNDTAYDVDNGNVDRAIPNDTPDVTVQ
jgi:tRNA dimethylallyltransferase